MRGIQIGEMSKLDWLIGLVKHAIWAIFYSLEYRTMEKVQKSSNSKVNT
jgi:hypothetical protein